MGKMEFFSISRVDHYLEKSPSPRGKEKKEGGTLEGRFPRPGKFAGTKRISSKRGFRPQEGREFGWERGGGFEGGGGYRGSFPSEGKREGGEGEFSVTRSSQQ